MMKNFTISDICVSLSQWLRRHSSVGHMIILSWYFIMLTVKLRHNRKRYKRHLQSFSPPLPLHCISFIYISLSFILYILFLGWTLTFLKRVELTSFLLKIRNYTDSNFQRTFKTFKSECMIYLKLSSSRFFFFNVQRIICLIVGQFKTAKRRKTKIQYSI